jgi:flagellar L-ring protein precursor FlgH
MKKALFPAVMTGLTLGSAAPLLAQSAPDPSAKVVPSTQYLMENNGGSLLQASEPQKPQDASAADPNRKDESFNFYAMEAPVPRVLKKHDLVNIVVNEESKSQTTGNSTQQRQVDFDAKVDAFVNFNLAKMSIHPNGASNNPPEIQLNGSRDFKGQGEYDRDDTMTTRLEAEVLDVKPNGTLVIEAKRTMKIDEEEISVTLTGECRVADIDATNSVLSTDLHDMNLKKSTKGEVHDTSQRGLLHRILDILNPF